MEKTELFLLYAVLVVLSAAAGIARESLLGLRVAHRGGSFEGGRKATGRLVLLDRSDEYLLTILIAGSLMVSAINCTNYTTPTGPAPILLASILPLRRARPPLIWA